MLDLTVEDLEPFLPAFPDAARTRVRVLQAARAAALRAGDLLRARGLHLSLQVQAIFWLPDEVLGVLQ